MSFTCDLGYRRQAGSNAPFSSSYRSQFELVTYRHYSATVRETTTVKSAGPEKELVSRGVEPRSLES